MDRLERLKLLFEDDTSLPSPATHLGPVLPPSPVPEVESGTATQVQPQHESSSLPTPLGPDPPSVSDDEADEYLAACIRTAERREQETRQKALRNASLITTGKAGRKGRNREQSQGCKARSPSKLMLETPLSACFCPLLAVSKLPYRFIRSEASEPIADRFFNHGKFWNRRWDL
ncbi:hypothetical protein VTN02DRAFT_2552 [Thermoascus thermophilus]